MGVWIVEKADSERQLEVILDEVFVGTDIKFIVSTFDPITQRPIYTVVAQKIKVDSVETAKQAQYDPNEVHYPYQIALKGNPPVLSSEETRLSSLDFNNIDSPEITAGYKSVVDRKVE